MKLCITCNEPIPRTIKINRKWRSVNNRTHCFVCVPLISFKSNDELRIEYNKNPNKCRQCTKPIVADNYEKVYDVQRKQFCDHTCSAKFSNKNRGSSPQRKWATLICQFCKVELKVWGPRRLRKFCSNRCKGLAGRGANSPNWKGGTTPDRDKFYNSKEWKKIRIQAFERDNYTCQTCDRRGGDLEANHIKPRSTFPELKLSIDNIETLCVLCHKKLTKEQIQLGIIVTGRKKI